MSRKRDINGLILNELEHEESFERLDMVFKETEAMALRLTVANLGLAKWMVERTFELAESGMKNQVMMASLDQFLRDPFPLDSQTKAAILEVLEVKYERATENGNEYNA